MSKLSTFFHALLPWAQKLPSEIEAEIAKIEKDTQAKIAALKGQQAQATAAVTVQTNVDNANKLIAHYKLLAKVDAKTPKADEEKKHGPTGPSGATGPST